MLTIDNSIDFALSEQIESVVQRALFITGSARSGTTILGKLVGSMAPNEYFFEPPLLFSLFTLLKELEPPAARLLFQTYLYEDLLIPALSGRNINLREQDDSSIVHIKPRSEINRRLQEHHRKSDIIAEKSQIVFKAPDFVYLLQKIEDILNIKNIIVLVREPKSTLSSIVNKKWFCDDSLIRGDITWPNRYTGNIPIPHWVPEHWVEEWASMSELDRAALYYITQTNIPEKCSQDPLVLDYQNLVDYPAETANRISDYFGLFQTEMTKKVIRSINFKSNDIDFDLTQLSNEMRQAVVTVYKKSSAQTV